MLLIIFLSYPCGLLSDVRLRHQDTSNIETTCISIKDIYKTKLTKESIKKPTNYRLLLQIKQNNTKY